MKNTKNNVTISIETFISLLHISTRAQGSCKEYAQNSIQKLEKFPNDKFWENSIKFWRAEALRVEDVCRKAREEAVYS
mgnify:FL=1